ncbi:MAG: glycosyltransferase [Patescibacteria group bacterium]|nr:glycosyltransferase [Patescibacteria group bacterium]
MEKRDKIKIIQVITTLGYGGAERLVLDLVSKLDKNIFEVRVVSMVRGGNLEKDFIAAGIRPLVLVKRTRLGLGVFLSLYLLFKKEKPAIVHTHLFGADIWAGLAARFAGVPAIVKTEHNLNLNEGMLKKIIKKMTVGIFKKIIAVSPAVADYAVVHEGAPRNKIKIIYNGIDFSRFSKKEKQNFSSPPVLINVARLEPQKGHEYLVRALYKIKDTPWMLWLVGEGALREKIIADVRGLGLEDRIELLGARQDVPSLLAQADIFIFPSLWEGMGLAAIEAAASGLPIIASAVGGLADIFQDKKNALLVPPRDEAALAKAIEWMIEHPSEALFMAREAKDYTEKEFSIQKMAYEYQSLYTKL